MVMSFIWTGMVLLSVLFALINNRGPEMSAAALEGAQAGCTLALGIGGAICLWSGVGRLMERSGLTHAVFLSLTHPHVYTQMPSGSPCHCPALYPDHFS